MLTQIEIDKLDLKIKPVVELLRYQGFETFESCQGGDGHCFDLPTVRFFGDEFDLIRAWEICSAYGMDICEAKRVYRKVDLYVDEKIKGLQWDKPFNEIVFRKV